MRKYGAIGWVLKDEAGQLVTEELCKYKGQLNP